MPTTWRLDNGEERLVELPADATLPAAGPGRYSCQMEGQPDETGDAATRDGEPGDDSAGAGRAGKLTVADVRPFLKPLAMLAAVGVSEYARRKRRQRKAGAGRAGSEGGDAGGGDGSGAYRTGDDP